MRGRARLARHVDLAFEAPARPARPVEKHLLLPSVDSDVTVRGIARLLLAGARYQRLHGDFGAEATGIAHLLEPYGVQTTAVRMALGLTHKEGGGRRGTAHAPNARLAEHGATLTGEVRQVRDNEVYFRAAYLANAAHRMQQVMDDGATQREALRREAPYYRAHEAARRGRLTAVAQVQHAANLFGQPEARGTLVGWYLNPLLNNEVECVSANRHNFYAEEGTVIGLPGSVHNRCGCYAGPPHAGASLVNDVLSNVVKFQKKSTPKFKLKGRTAS